MQEFVLRAFVLDTPGWFLLLTMTAAALWVIYLLLDDMLIVLAASPVLFIGAALANNFMRENGYEFSADKVVNTGFGVGVGLFSASVLMVVTVWMFHAAKAR